MRLAKFFEPGCTGVHGPPVEVDLNDRFSTNKNEGRAFFKNKEHSEAPRQGMRQQASLRFLSSPRVCLRSHPTRVFNRSISVITLAEREVGEKSAESCLGTISSVLDCPDCSRSTPFLCQPHPKSKIQII